MSKSVLLMLLAAATSSNAAILSFQNTFTEDNADVYSQLHKLQYTKPIDSRFDKLKLGMHAGRLNIEEQNTNKTFSFVGVNAELINKPLGKFTASLSNYISNTWNPINYQLAYQKEYLKDYYIEFNIEHNIVDALAAINQQIDVDSYSFSIDIPVADHFTFVFAGISQQFSDNNSKQGVVLKTIYTFKQVEGLNAALVFKQMNSRTTVTEYFSPDQQTQLYLEATYARPVFNDKYHFKTTLGFGQEEINQSVKNDLLKAEVALRGWINDNNGIESKLGCNNSADKLSSRNTGQYRYCYVQFNYNHNF